MISELNRENCCSLSHDSDDVVLIAYLSRTASSRQLKALIELSEEYDGAGSIIEKVPGTLKSTRISVTDLVDQLARIGISSVVLPPRETMTMTSPPWSVPSPPCTASQGGRNMAPRSIQQSEWANFFAATPEDPLAHVTMRGHAVSASTAAANSGRSTTGAIPATAAASISVDFLASSND